MNTNSIKALERAIKIAGSQAELARLITSKQKQVKQQHIWNWLHRDKKVPPDMAIPIERATGVSRHETRRDIYPLEQAA